jgi:DNA/RNA-binding domain of Phe-tRNA-synthetase-like protein
MIAVHDHPLLDAAAFLTTLPAPLGEIAVPSSIRDLFDLSWEGPLTRSEAVKTAVRDLLRHGGFKPAGRSKPASEYLVKAVESGWLSPTQGINAAVDALNAVSLHSGLPISVVDADLARAPFHIAVAAPGTSYVFNPSGQELKLDGLVALFDAEGPCANSVKDSQRTKTHDGTIRTLTVVWGTNALPGRARAAADWNRQLLEALGATTEAVPVG